MLLLVLLLQTSFAQILTASAKDPKKQTAYGAYLTIRSGFDHYGIGCTVRGDKECLPDVPALDIKGTPEIAKQLKEYWKIQRRKETLNDIKAQEEDFLAAVRASDELLMIGFNQGISYSNLRRLYSQGNYFG